MKSVNSRFCEKCIYHTIIGLGGHDVACIYALRTGKCRTLEPGYKEGECSHFTTKRPRAHWMSEWYSGKSGIDK